MCFCCGNNIRDKTDKDKLKDNIFDNLRPICNKCDNYKPSRIGNII